MAFTDHSDIYGAVHEDGINRVVRHIMRQRPSLFNYATQIFAQRPDLFCEKIDVAAEVIQAQNPIFTVEKPLPVLGTPTPVGLNFCVQLTDFQIDFHPANTIQLPPELSPLAQQRLALRIRACVGMDCPSDSVIADILPRMEVLATAEDKPLFGTNMLATGGLVATRALAASDVRASRGLVRGDIFLPPTGGVLDPGRGTDDGIIVLPTRQINCFCLELFAVAHFEWGTIGSSPQQWLKTRLDGIEIVDLQPTPMEDMIECYLKLVLRLGVLPRLSIKLEKMVLDITKIIRDQGIAFGDEVTIEPAPVPAGVPHNPAIENDLVKVFANLIVRSA
ncbi:MAG: hypothetical protein R3E39_12225 [Anaerolineae bacterium]